MPSLIGTFPTCLESTCLWLPYPTRHSTWWFPFLNCNETSTAQSIIDALYTTPELTSKLLGPFVMYCRSLVICSLQHHSRQTMPPPIHFFTRQWDTKSPNCGICSTGGLKKNPTSQNSLYSLTTVSTIGQIISPSTLHPVYIKYSAPVTCTGQISFCRLYVKLLPVTMRVCLSAHVLCTDRNVSDTLMSAVFHSLLVNIEIV